MEFGIITIVWSVTVLVLVRLLFRFLKRRNYPPGPPGLPILGNLLQVGRNKPYLALTEFARKYGEVVSIDLGTHSFVIINSIKAAKEAFLTNGKAFEGRPRFYTAELLHGTDQMFLSSPVVHDSLRTFRKSLVTNVRDASSRFESLICEEIQKMSSKLFANGEKNVTTELTDYIHDAAVNISVGLAFGETFSLDDPLLRKWGHDLQEYAELLSWYRLENFLPLSSLYMHSHKKRIKTFRGGNQTLFRIAFDRIRKKMAKERRDTISMGEMLIQALDDKTTLISTDDDVMAILRDSMFGASEGPYHIVIYVLYKILSQPNLQENLHQELDKVLGERLPTLDDGRFLPYTKAIIRESLRHGELPALGIPRRTTDDVTVCGHRVPNDTDIVVNVYNIHRDKKFWKITDEFEPKRFLGENRELLPDSSFSFMPFSFGQRNCIGKQFILNATLLFFSRFFQVFKVSAPVGVALPEEINDGGSFNPDVKPFKMTIERRKITH